MQKNISQFNEFSAKILSYLYDRFPAPTAIETHVVIGGEINEEEMEICERTQFGISTINWLRAEGFIVAEGGNFGYFNGCYLTAKGLTALSAMPESLEKYESVIDRMKSGLAAGSAEVIKSAIDACVSVLVGRSL